MGEQLNRNPWAAAVTDTVPTQLLATGCEASNKHPAYVAATMTLLTRGEANQLRIEETTAGPWKRLILGEQLIETPWAAAVTDTVPTQLLATGCEASNKHPAYVAATMTLLTRGRQINCA